MKTPKLTIVIPVYNTGKYLNRCFESVINQSEQNIEIIVVNDGSTDNSKNIIEYYANKYVNIYPIHIEKNIGVGNARNIGIENTKTKYIGFVDSDDWIDISYYQQMLEMIDKDNTDICISGIKTEVDDIYNWKYRYNYPENIIVDSSFCLHSLINQFNTDIAISPIINNKIYRKSLIVDNNIYFDRSRRAQDVYFSFMIFIFADKISINKNVFYHYYQRDLSATHNFSTTYVDDYYYILLSIKNELKERELYTKYENEYYRYVNSRVTKLINNMFNNVQDVIEQKRNIVYILNRMSNLISIDKIVEYIDIERIKRFWYI